MADYLVSTTDPDLAKVDFLGKPPGKEFSLPDSFSGLCIERRVVRPGTHKGPPRPPSHPVPLHFGGPPHHLVTARWTHGRGGGPDEM